MSQMADVAGAQEPKRKSAPPALQKRRRRFYHSERVLFVIGVVCISLAALLLVIDARLPSAVTAQTDTLPAVVR